MNGVKSVLSLLVLSGIILALARNPTGTVKLINAGSNAFAQTYRTVSGTDPKQTRVGV